MHRKNAKDTVVMPPRSRLGAPRSITPEQGATLVEAALIGAVLIGAIATSIYYLQGSTEKRINTGRSTFGCAEMCDPGSEHCQCSDSTGECTCQAN